MLKNYLLIFSWFAPIRSVFSTRIHPSRSFFVLSDLDQTDLAVIKSFGRFPDHLSCDTRDLGKDFLF